jgi:polygalacturonase
MRQEIDRRTLLRLSALAGAGGLALPLLGSQAAAASPAGRLARADRGGGMAAADAAADRIVASVRRPVFPRRVFPVTRFGAAGDGTTDCSAAFRAAIAACHRVGGGHVLVPAGDYLTGPIHLLSNTDLHLASGSTIKFSQDPAAYLPVVFTRWQGIELLNY